MTAPDRSSARLNFPLAAQGPSTDDSTLAFSLAMQGQTAKSQAEFEKAFAKDPSSWRVWIFPAVFLNAGNSAELLKSHPSAIRQATIDCWNEINMAAVATTKTKRIAGAARVKACGKSGDLDAYQELAALAALGDLDSAFELAEQPSFESHDAIFAPTSQDLRADPRFEPLVQKLGLMSYWKATGSRPDFCEKEALPSCDELGGSSDNQ